jgi:Putative prokaryotic signal transducing protein
MALRERQCQDCGRIYDEQDWAEPDCPFCGAPLEPIGGENPPLISDFVSTRLEWTPGQPRAMVCTASGYLEAQIIKAQLESAGVPVYLAGESAATIYGLSVGPMAEYRVYVPQNRLEFARTVVNTKS